MLVSGVILRALTRAFGDASAHSPAMKWEEIDQQACSVARALSVLGERWTLLIVRDAFRGTRRFDEFQRSLGVTRHRLAERLRKLVDEGVLTRVAYMDRPTRYEYRLTRKGLALYPVLLTLSHWGTTGWMTVMVRRRTIASFAVTTRDRY